MELAPPPQRHDRESVAQSYVLDDCGVADALVLAEDAVGKRDALPSHFKRSAAELIDVDILTGQLVCHFTSFQDDLPAIVGQAELLAHVTLFTMAQDAGKPRRRHVQSAVHVLEQAVLRAVGSLHAGLRLAGVRASISIFSSARARPNWVKP
jgi:hypothetical protein